MAGLPEIAQWLGVVVRDGAAAGLPPSVTVAPGATLRAKDMSEGVHVRLMVTRGRKSTPYQDPRVTVGPATVVIIPEHTEATPATVTHGITRANVLRALGALGVDLGVLGWV